MKLPAFSDMPVAALAIVFAAMILTAPPAHSQTDVENTCTSSGGNYTSEVVRPHWNEEPKLIETCCTGSGSSPQCVDYENGVQVDTYGGAG
jgi:hypothetical protein